MAIVAFSGASAFTELATPEIERGAIDVAANALPSVLNLNAMRGSVRECDGAAFAIVASRTNDLATRTALTTSASNLERGVLAERSIPTFPAEGALHAELPQQVARLVAGARALAVAETEADLFVDAATLHLETGHLDELLAEIVELNATEGLRLATTIAASQRRSTFFALTLDVAAALLALTASYIAFRYHRRHEALLRRHEEVLESRALELERFADRVAHDIRNPIGTASLSLDFIQHGAPMSGVAAEGVQRAARCLRRADKIVGALFEFARSNAPPGNATTNLHAVADEIMSDLRSTPDAAGASISVEEFDLPAVRCGEGALASVLWNLVDNALKHTSRTEARRVVVRASQRGAFVRCEVEDNGPGLPAGAEASVFLPFARAEGAGESGLGLGLATVRRLVEAHGGHVGVQPSERQGATFWFELPTAALGLQPERSSPRDARRRAKGTPCSNDTAPRGAKWVLGKAGARVERSPRLAPERISRSCAPSELCC